MRHARGIAAYDPLTVPLTFANDRTTGGSSETLVALGGNYEKDWFGLLVGAYLRFFRDGDPSPTSTQKYDEGILVLRPQAYIGEHWGVAVEGSYQARRLGVVDPTTDSAYTASAWRAGIIPYFSPSGRGSYKRPQLRLLYALTARDAGARGLYPQEDVFAQRKVEHFIGLGAEWWFNSSSYP
jgi:maltoporin